MDQHRASHPRQWLGRAHLIVGISDRATGNPNSMATSYGAGATVINTIETGVYETIPQPDPTGQGQGKRGQRGDSS